MEYNGDDMTHRQKVKKLYKGDKILWAGLIFFSIPVLVLIVILIQSSLGTGKVIDGSRFKNDLSPEITQALIQETQTKLESLDKVNTVSLNLKAATLMIEVKLDSTLKNEDFVKKATEIVNTIDVNLPINTYFTSTDTMKMYDLQVDLYNTVSETDSTVQFHTILIKNGNMLEWSIQDVSTALNEELAQQLRDAVEAKNNPTEPTTPTTPTEGTESTTTQ